MIVAEQQKVSDCTFVEPIADCGILPNAIEAIAEDNRAWHLSVKQGLDTKMIAGAEQAAPAPVPDCKSKISKQPVDASDSPRVVCVQNEFNIGRVVTRRASVSRQPSSQFASRIYPSIRRDPGAPVQSGRLSFELGVACGAQQRVAESDRAIDPEALTIGAPVR
jgi:hypothetical protein